jgi:DNA polymerase-3 subunit gamma/tau
MSNYQVLARKWRPQTFESVVGQDAITRTLKNALTAGRIGHAYLFAGPRGIGKTTTARLLARALLCPERKGTEACGVCEVCLESLESAGNAYDIREIDAASNRGIDEIRALRDGVKIGPARGRYKVYIIDEVHQLTEAAFNALLKTLEEPPAHVVFILATTDPRELPQTILSRVQRFDFRPITPEALTASLERILREEKVSYEPGALPVIVRASEGSLRDALSLLDTAIAYGNGTLEAETTATLLGATASRDVRAFAAALFAHDTVAAVEAIDRAARDGDDIQAFARDVIELLRRSLVLKAAPAAKMSDLTPVETEELQALGGPVALDEILYVVRAFLDADALMRESPHPRIELEIAAIRATRRPVPHELDTVLKRVEEALARAGTVAPAAAAPAQTSLLAGPEPPPAPAPVRRPVAAAPPPTATPPPPAAPSADLTTEWERVVEEVMGKKALLGSILAQARPRSVVGGELTLEVTASQFQRDLLADRANREIVMQAIRRSVAGADRFTVGGEIAGTPGPAAHPAVLAAIAEFGGEVVAVRPRQREGDGQ